MILGIVQERVGSVPRQASDKAGVRFVFSGKRLHMTTVCLAVVGAMSIVPSALSQTALRSTPDAAVQHSTCTSDPQGLMCHSNQREVDGAPTTQTSHAASSTMLPTLSDAQLERLSDILLGLLYFVLPIGFGLALFLHDRYQAYRTATLEAQIKLLEKLWEQTPQA